MQFSHVNDMSTEEILDYAVLHGDNTSDLSIKSFTNLEVRDFSENDWISIFLDLMVSIMEVENPLVLRNQPTTKGIYYYFYLSMWSFTLHFSKPFKIFDCLAYPNLSATLATDQK